LKEGEESMIMEGRGQSRSQEGQELRHFREVLEEGGLQVCSVGLLPGLEEKEEEVEAEAEAEGPQLRC